MTRAIRAPEGPAGARLAAALLIAGSALLSQVAGAQPVSAADYPTRDVTLVVGYAAGGTGDVIARVLSEPLKEKLGKAVIVDNKPGASGSTAASHVAKSAPDGQTLLVGQTAEISINPFLMKLNHDPQADLVPIAIAAVVPLGLVAPAKATYATLTEALAQSKLAPSGFTFANSGIGTPSHFATEILRKNTDARFTVVPYKGAGPALNDVLGGHVDLFFAGLPAAVANVRAGRMKLLSVSSAARASSLPDVPTIAEEAKIPGFDITLWVGFFAPKGTPAEIIERLNTYINAILATPEVKERFKAEGAEIHLLSVPETAAFTKAESEKYSKLIKELNITLN